MRDDFLVFGSPYIGEEEIEELLETVRSGWLGPGPRVERFEHDFGEYKGAAHSVAMSSCSAALHVSMLALDIKPGDEVITTPLTFAATANAIVHAGGIPVFADVDRKTMNLDPVAVEAAITGRTKVLLPVHFAGRPCDMDALTRIRREHDLILVEDCAHAVETRYHGVPAGRFGNAGCFSFYVTKNVVAGEGGMLITDDAALADRCRVLALHGLSRDAWHRFKDAGHRHYEVVAPGFKYPMTDMFAALAIHQLERVERMLVRREQIWQRYDEAFAGLPCFTPTAAEDDTRHARHLYTLVLDVDELGRSRDDVIDALCSENIGIGVHYRPLHLHPYYKETYGFTRGAFPNAEFIGDRTVSLPLSPKLTDEDAEDVIETVRRVLGASASAR